MSKRRSAKVRWYVKESGGVTCRVGNRVDGFDWKIHDIDADFINRIYDLARTSDLRWKSYEAEFGRCLPIANLYMKLLGWKP